MLERVGILRREGKREGGCADEDPVAKASFPLASSSDVDVVC